MMLRPQVSGVLMAVLTAWSVSSESSTTGQQHQPVVKEYCEAETFTASCPPLHVILIRKAFYGRMRLGRCVIRDYGYVGCHADILAHMDAQCSGSASCEVRIPDAVLDRANPCPRDFKTYLEVSYECVPVYTVKCKNQCNITETSPHVISFTPVSSAPVLMTSSSSSGFIMTDLNPKQTTVTSAACLNRVCQVIVKALPGQRLNITLLDFTLEEEERNQLRHQLHGVETCYRYAVIRELSKSRDIDVCGGLRRTRHVYTSQNHELQVQFVSSLVHDRVPKFLVQYQVLGCADIVAPKNSWVRRDDNTMTVHCSSADQQVYQVICVDNQWTGHVGSCTPVSKTLQNAESAVATDDITDEYPASDSYYRPTGLFAAIVALLAALMATFVLAVGIIAIKRCSPDTTGNTKNQKLRSQYDVSDDVEDPTATNQDFCCNKSIITYTSPVSDVRSKMDVSACRSDDVRSTYGHHYDYNVQQQQQQQSNISSSTYSPTTTLPLPTNVTANSYTKFDDVRYSAVRAAPDECVSSLAEDSSFPRDLGYQLHCSGLTLDGTTSICACVNPPCINVKYTPHLTTVAELELNHVSSANNSQSVYS